MKNDFTLEFKAQFSLFRTRFYWFLAGRLVLFQNVIGKHQDIVSCAKYLFNPNVSMEYAKVCGILFTGVVLIFSRLFINSRVVPEYLRWRNVSIKSQRDLEKFRTSIYMLAYYLSSLVLGIYVLRNEKLVSLIKNCSTPLDKIPKKFAVLYYYKIGFYLSEFIKALYERAAERHSKLPSTT